MRFTFLTLVFISQVFGESEAIHPGVLELAVDKILDTFNKEHHQLIQPYIHEALSKINPENTKDLLNLCVDTLRNQQGTITPTFLAGVIAGINASLNSKRSEHDNSVDLNKNNPLNQDIVGYHDVDPMLLESDEQTT